MVADRSCLSRVQVPEDGSDIQHPGRVQAATAGAGLGVGDAALPESPRDQCVPPNTAMAAQAVRVTIIAVFRLILEALLWWQPVCVWALLYGWLCVLSSIPMAVLAVPAVDCLAQTCPEMSSGDVSLCRNSALH